jgi:ATP-dependent protease ClpP protease subunit
MNDIPNIPNRADMLYVIFTAEINPTTVERLTAVMTQAMRRNVQEVYLAMSTSGGQVQAGVALYNTLLAMPFKLSTHNIGSVNSMGNVVFLAGAQRYASPHSTFMFHGVGFDVKGPTRIEEKQARDYLDSISADQSRMGGIITSRTNVHAAEVAELFRSQQTVDASWSKDHGMIEDIRDFNIAPGKPVVSLVFQR